MGSGMLPHPQGHQWHPTFKNLRRPTPERACLTRHSSDVMHSKAKSCKLLMQAAHASCSCMPTYGYVQAKGVCQSSNTGTHFDRGQRLTCCCWSVCVGFTPHSKQQSCVCGKQNPTAKALQPAGKVEYVLEQATLALPCSSYRSSCTCKCILFCLDAIKSVSLLVRLTRPARAASLCEQQLLTFAGLSWGLNS